MVFKSKPSRAAARGLAAQVIALVGALAFSGAHAQIVAAADGAVAGKPLAAVIDMSDARATFQLRYAQASALEQAALPNKTAIDRSFASSSVVGSLGYLCGVNSAAPGAEDRGGPASSFGHGTTFLGARISYAFR